MQKALNAAQIGTWHWCVDDGTLIVNEAFADVCGLASTGAEPFTIRHWLRLIHSEDKKLVIEKFGSLRQSRVKQISLPCRVRHKNDEWIWVQISGSILRPDLVGNRFSIAGTMTEISELYQAREALLYHHQAEKLLTEISASFAAIQIDDIDPAIDLALEKLGKFLKTDRCYVFQFRNNNSRMDNSHEWCNEQVTAEKPNLQNIPSSVFPWWMKKLNKHERIHIPSVTGLPPEATSEKEILLKQKIKSLMVVPVHFQKNLLGFLGFDTVKKEKTWEEADFFLAENVATIIAHAFNAAIQHKLLLCTLQKAEESDRAKSSFLATVNHELRTPLHHILGFSDLLRTESIPEADIPNFADRIYVSGKKLLHIIEDILYLSFADEPYVKLRKEHFKGAELFAQHQSFLKEMLASSNKGPAVSLKFSPSDDLIRNHFISDINKINQVVVNLMKNAIKFTEKGHVEYRAEVVKKTLVFRIKDSGIGIPQHQQELIFDFFRQIDDTSTRIYSGIGIGLTISKRIAQLLNGQLSVTSIPGKGTTFTFQVPVELVPNLQETVGFCCGSDGKTSPDNQK